MPADAGDVGDLDGVGAHAVGDLGGDRVSGAWPGQLRRQQRLARGDRGEHHRRPAAVGRQHRGDRGEGAFRHRVARQLGQAKVLWCDLVAVFHVLGGDHDRHALDLSRGAGGGLGAGLVGQHRFGDDEGPEAQYRRSA
ncbi:hypothetical protein LJR219_003154 [Phenylobacterium sp. LjRoot219]